MPRGDRTGPMGDGPRTGRGYGFCSGYDRPGFMQFGPGLGYGGRMGWGRGRVRGFRSRFMGWGAPVPGPTPEEEVNDLKMHASWLKEHLDMVQLRIDELTGKSGEV